VSKRCEDLGDHGQPYRMGSSVSVEYNGSYYRAVVEAAARDGGSWTLTVNYGHFTETHVPTDRIRAGVTVGRHRGLQNTVGRTMRDRTAKRARK
jgi:hypothetical protein